ncbi:universal stress protein [Streptomyces bambusae]|uniref:universal stress protein n=1 Tax=Streptomyces bambusae TaxID=1550616 RepID=UPI001CFE3410|nr:universal stress protein [Streptomyces bambusae]MCB5163840.1 universal stress protein [Streptomyces bambusae]
MTGTGTWETARDIVVGIDPVREWHLPLAWAADEAHRRHLPLHVLLAVPPWHGEHHAAEPAETPAERLAAAVAWARDRHPELAVTGDLRSGPPAPTFAGAARHARMAVLGSRHLGRTAEVLSAGSVVVPVAAQASCPVVVVGDAEHLTQQPPYIVVGIDGSHGADAALRFALDDADLRGATVRAVSVWQPPVFLLHDEEVALQAQRALLAEATAGLSEKYPDVRLTHEVLIGHPVEELADAAEHALAVVVGRRGRGGYTGMRLGSVVHGLLHRAHCPVITVPSG